MVIRKLFAPVVFVSIMALAGCLVSKWDTLKQAEAQNLADLNYHCHTAPDSALCEQAEQERISLANTRAQYVREEQVACENAWVQYERDLLNYDRKYAAYERELERHDRDKERKDLQCEREKDRYERAMDRYQRCEDRNAASGTYGYCSAPSYPLCLASINLGPTKPSEPRRPFCTR